MTRDAAFLQAVLDSPDDDAPRLIYADWLDERGDAARAEFIRVQCEAARLPQIDTRTGILQRRANELLLDHRHDWDSPLYQALGLHEPENSWLRRMVRRIRLRQLLPFIFVPRALKSWKYRRGFISAVELGMREFLDHADALFRVAPVEELVFRSGSPELLPILLASPHLARLRNLELSAQEIDDADARLLGESPHLVRLRALNLQANQIGPDGAGALAAAPNMAGITELLLGMNPIGDAGALRLAESSHFSRLRWIDVSDCGLSPAGAEALRERFPHARITF